MSRREGTDEERDDRDRLLRELEALHAILKTNDAGPRSGSVAQDNVIPLLRQVLPEDVGDEAPPDTSATPAGHVLDPEPLLELLFDEAWRERSDALLDDARRRADALGASLDEEARAERDARFRRRLQEDLGPRLEALVAESMEALRARLTDRLRTELTRLVDACYGPGDDRSTHDDRERN
ncbi:MAG: hypothetical protein V2I63_11715 [Pseudomonadales bacterium]|nr:hypothetical protein [Pseudomonadales bacterium]